METLDIVIVKRCLAGDKEAFSELITKYKRLIYNVIYNMINNKEEVNDIAQEVFIRIYRALDKYDPQYKFSTWSVKIATNYCLDVIRKKKVDTMPIDEAVGVSSDIDTPESSYLKREQSDRVNYELSKLPEKYRVPLILYHKNGLSYEEMTKVLNEPMTIIKNRLFRARQMLKEKLSAERKEGIL
ncbi:sigma-70 family RNA polymerase sigma factor [Acetivibrio cellulolyticus]|uniref:sigma-70 family RNA polymerase sigma factor n=1 Tax=Acetivibrio cellulolyticus TaxID=35830 RepID=UPI0001E300E6|nr:sigma-70 family RNA polymerase sigma factor [Acetivibrio cellulolyticus]